MLLKQLSYPAASFTRLPVIRPLTRTFSKYWGVIDYIMGDNRAAVVWSTSIPESENTTRYQRAAVLDQKYDCDFFFFGNSSWSDNHNYDNVRCVDRKGILSGINFSLQVIYFVVIDNNEDYKVLHTSYHPLVCILGALCSVSSDKWVHDIWDHPVLTLPDFPKITNPFKMTTFLIKYAVYRISVYALIGADVVVLSLHPSAIEDFPLSQTKIVSIPNGTDLDIYTGIDSSEPDDFTVVYVGAVQPDRGAEAMLKATADLSTEINNITMILVGRVDDMDWLRTEIQNYKVDDTVEITGRIPHYEALKFIKSADIGFCLFPKSKETDSIYPIKLFEYMALNTVTVASELNGISSVIENGRNGYLVPPADGEYAARKILNAYQIDTTKIESNARKTVEEYDWNVLNKKFESAIEFN